MLETEIIGIKFEFSREYLNHFAQLFENVSVEKYTWHVSCSENYLSCDGKIYQFLPDGIYSGKEFASMIQSLSEYYIHLICIYAVPIGKEFDSSAISTYQDYANSHAEIALLSADSFADLYVKDLNSLKEIFSSCEKYYGNGTISPQFITKENDEREKFEV